MTGQDPTAVTEEELWVEHPARGYRYAVVEYPDRPDECTIAPRDPDRAATLTTWITARADCTLDLAEMR